MKLIRTGSFFCSLVLFCFVVAFVAFPAMAWQKVREAVRRQDARETRQAITRLQVRIGAWLFRCIRRIMRVELELDLRSKGAHPGPFIVVMNHTSMFDILAVLWVLAEYGRDDLRWIIKREMMDAPFLGRMARWSGNGFVDRNGNPADRDAVTACAILANEDDSSVVIFVEGTRDPYELRPPKPGGFLRLIEALPCHAGLLVTVAWHPVTRDGGRTLFEGAALYGKRLFVSAEIVAPELLRLSGFLGTDWRVRKDRIDAWRKRQYFAKMIERTPESV
ncbi:1-acyl-sn-glycerol-3-phosphate acyltransferase [Candidatus Uhrbacteria bacterium]|nr:MAG: 1-acyl-sn-glycerol-3-phosphate acyltransferase [Candidatus Uhrbacteria bacterium]